MKELDDASLARSALAGSQGAYEEILRRFQRPVFSLVRRMVRNDAVAEELAQEAFLRAFTHLDRYDPTRKFSSWLFKIAHNRTIDFLRRKRLPTVPIETESEAFDPIDRLAGGPDSRAERSLERREQLEALEGALDELRPEYREAVVLRFVHELSYQEVSEILDIPLGTLKTRLHRARKQMAASLAQAGWGSEAHTGGAAGKHRKGAKPLQRGPRSGS